MFSHYAKLCSWAHAWPIYALRAVSLCKLPHLDIDKPQDCIKVQNQVKGLRSQETVNPIKQPIACSTSLLGHDNVVLRAEPFTVQLAVHVMLAVR